MPHGLPWFSALHHSSDFGIRGGGSPWEEWKVGLTELRRQRLEFGVIDISEICSEGYQRGGSWMGIGVAEVYMGVSLRFWLRSEVCVAYMQDEMLQYRPMRELLLKKAEWKYLGLCSAGKCWKCIWNQSGDSSLRTLSHALGGRNMLFSKVHTLRLRSK